MHSLFPRFAAGSGHDPLGAPPVPPSAIKRLDTASREDFEWGSFYTYYTGETYGTMDTLTGVAIIKPGMQIHPPHVHVEEEYLMVTQGEGMWHLKGEELPAKAGDILYAAPWEIHGITNTGSEPMTFVVWKWNSKGVELPAQPG